MAQIYVRNCFLEVALKCRYSNNVIIMTVSRNESKHYDLIRVSISLNK